MTKKIELINKIEASRMTEGFDRDFLMSKDERYLTWAYNKCLELIAYCEKYNITR
jgi:hypothetical protein